MMYELDSYGKIAGNIFTDYSSPEAITESLLLPLPTREKLEFPITSDSALATTQ